MDSQPIKKVIIEDEKSTPQARASRLRRVRNLANLSRKELCEKAGINVNTFKGWELARYGGLPRDGAKKVILATKQCGIEATIDWLLHEIGNAPKVLENYAPISSTQQPLETTHIQHDESYANTELLLFRKNHPNSIDLKIYDDGMEPIYEKGDLVAGTPLNGEDIKKLIHQNCIIHLANGQIVARNIRATKEGNKFSLICINPKTTVTEPIIHNVEISSAAKIIWHRKILGEDIE